jgi:hypothetical protein
MPADDVGLRHVIGADDAWITADDVPEELLFEG